MYQTYMNIASIWGLIYGFGYMSHWIRTQTKFPLPETDTLSDIILRGIFIGFTTLLVCIFAAVLMPITILEHVYKKIKELVTK